MHTKLAILFWFAWGLIAYTYLVFPVLLEILARLLPPRRVQPFDSFLPLPKIAMVVSAHNEETVIEAKLENTRGLIYPSDLFELYIGSDGSTDDTNERLRRQHDTRFHIFTFERRRGKTAVLNDLVRQTDAEIVVMCDANTMFEADALLQLVAPFRDPAVGCVSGQLHLDSNGGVSGEGVYWKFENWIKRNESRLGFLIGCNGGIFVIRRALYTPLPNSTIIEDFVMSMRVLQQGYRVVFEASAKASEPASCSLREEMARKARIGAGDWQALGLTSPLLSPRYGLIAFAYWGHKVIRWCVPFFIIVGAAASLGLTDVPLYHALVITQAAGALVSIGAYYEWIGPRIMAFSRPMAYFGLMNYALMCGFLRFLLNAQRVTWEHSLRFPSPSLEQRPEPVRK